MPRNSPIPNVEFRDFSILAELHNHYHNLTLELFTSLQRNRLSSTLTSVFLLPAAPSDPDLSCVSVICSPK